MSWDEFKTRARQEVSKRWDGTLYHLGARFDTTLIERDSPERPAFFFTPSEVPHIVTLLREHLPDEAERIVREAERICHHDFDLLGYEGVHYGPDIDWHVDAVNGNRSPDRIWYTINLFDFARLGDPKVTWELNRHQHLITLAKAYCLSGQDRFFQEIIHQWYDWQRKNPYPVGVNWASSLEVAFRSLSWIWAWHLLEAVVALPPGFRQDLRRALGLNGRHIERYLSTYSSPNTHLLGELVALLFIAILVPDLPSSSQRRDAAWRALLGEAERQVRPDGLYFEQSIHYHVYALDFFLHSRILAALNGISIPPPFDRTIHKMLEILSALSDAGPPPRLGDDDGGRLFNPHRNRAEHMLDPLSTGAVLFESSQFKAVAGRLREETLWLLGPAGAKRFSELEDSRPSPTSRAFEPSGIYILASSDPVPHRLAVNCGVPGTASGGHGHADALSAELAMEGKAWLIDPGAFSFPSATGDRDAFRGTAAHNALQVDGANQADPAGPFAWRGLQRANVEAWTTGETFDLLIASHRGYCRLADPVEHRRWIFHLKSGFCVIRDLALGRQPHQLDLFWHLAPSLAPRRTERSAAWSFTRPGENLSLSFLALTGPGWIREVVQGPASPAYGRLQSGPVLHFGSRAQLPAEVITLLLLTTLRMGEEAGTLTRIQGAEQARFLSACRYHTPESCHYMFFSDSMKPWTLDRWASDARLLYVCVPLTGGGIRAILCDGSYADFDGRRVIGCRQTVARCEVIGEGGGQRAFCSDDSAPDSVSLEALA